MKIFVTGGTGMTGAHLLLKLLETGHEVVAIKRETGNTQFTKNIFNYHSKEGDKLFSKIKWVNVDLLDYEKIEQEMQTCEIVYHTAAMVSFKPKDHDLMIYNNVQGTANIVNAALKTRIKKLCHVSSVAALGETSPGKELTEEIDNVEYKNVSGYAISKHKSEREVWRGIAEGLNAVIVNPTIILGAGNWIHGSPRMIKTIWDGLKFYSKGQNGFIDVKDVVNTMITLTENNISDQRYILNGENLPFRTVFNMIADSLKKKRPSILANSIMLHSLKIYDQIRYFFSGKEPRLTKHTLRSSQQFQSFSNKKIKDAIDFKPRRIKDTIEEICKIFLPEFNSN